MTWSLTVQMILMMNLNWCPTIHLSSVPSKICWNVIQDTPDVSQELKNVFITSQRKHSF